MQKECAAEVDHPKVGVGGGGKGQKEGNKDEEEREEDVPSTHMPRKRQLANTT